MTPASCLTSPRGTRREALKCQGAEAVEPWVETIIRLWDDAAYYQRCSRAARERAQAWHSDRLAPLYREFFSRRGGTNEGLSQGKVTMPLKSSLTAVLVLFAGALCAAAGNIEYTVTDLGSLAGPTSVATCINNNGWVAGWADDDPVYRYAHAWVWTGSEPLQDLGSFGGLQSVSDVTGLNDNGWAVGQSNLSASSTAATQGFLWTGSGSIQNIGSLGGQNTLPWGINDAGVIVGQSQAADGSYHGFLYTAGVMTDLGSGIPPVAINDSGQIVGQFLVTSGGITTNYSAFISSGGTYTDLGTLGGTATQVWKINGAGAAVGFSDIASGDRHAFIYTDQIQDLGTLGGPESFAYGINSAGLVVGSSDIDSSGDMDAFIWMRGYGNG